MSPNGFLIVVYSVYAAVSVGLVVYLARTLFRNGAVFLEDVFVDRPQMAAAVNKLLVIGFYLLNLGGAFLILRANAAPDALVAVEVLAVKLGSLFVALGVLHLANMYVFYRIRRRALLSQMPPPAGASYGYGPAPYEPTGYPPPNVAG